MKKGSIYFFWEKEVQLWRNHGSLNFKDWEVQRGEGGGESQSDPAGSEGQAPVVKYSASKMWVVQCAKYDQEK